MTLRYLERVMCVGLVFAIGACGSTSPSPEPSKPRSVPTACIGLLATQCEQAIAALAINVPGVTPSYVSISLKLCDGACPGEERGVWLGGLKVDLSDGRKSLNVHIEVDGATVTWELIETAYEAMTPRSARLTAPTTEFTVGHCGLGSGIDVDGSFWDPVGMIDIAAPGLISSDKARFTLNSPDSAILVTQGGVVLQLVRHPGPNWSVPCD